MGDGVNCDPCKSGLETVRAKVAGHKLFTVIYYLVILVAVIMFIASAYSIIAPVVEGETVTAVETTFLEEIRYPTIFGCLAPPLAALLRRRDGAIRVGPLSSSLPCREGQGILINGRLEQLERGRNDASCLNLVTSSTADRPEDRAVLRGLNASFGSDLCFLINTDGSYRSTPENTRELLISYRQDTAFVNEALYGVIGVYEVGTSPFNDRGELTAAYYRLGGQNTVSTVGLEQSTLVDKRRESFITIPSNPVLDINTGEEETTQLYTLSVATTTKYYQYLPNSDTLAAPVVRSGTSGPESDILFYVNSFSSEIITLRKRSFAEVWAMLGGAISGALVIVTWFFMEEVVELPDGSGATEKVQVFRYRWFTSSKEEAVAFIKKFAPSGGHNGTYGGQNLEMNAKRGGSS